MKEKVLRNTEIRNMHEMAQRFERAFHQVNVQDLWYSLERKNVIRSDKIQLHVLIGT